MNRPSARRIYASQPDTSRSGADSPTAVEHELLSQERTIAWLARKAGVHPTYAWKMIRGQRPLTTEFRAAAAEALGVPEDILFPASPGAEAVS